MFGRRGGVVNSKCTYVVTLVQSSSVVLLTILLRKARQRPAAAALLTAAVQIDRGTSRTLTKTAAPSRREVIVRCPHARGNGAIATAIRHPTRPTLTVNCLGHRLHTVGMAAKAIKQPGSIAGSKLLKKTTPSRSYRRLAPYR